MHGYRDDHADAVNPLAHDGMAAPAPGLFESVPTENGADFTAGEDAEPSQLPL